MRPCRLVRASCANIARGFQWLRRGLGWGLCPHAPARELSSLDLPLFTPCLRYTAKECAPIVSRTSRDQIHALTAVAGL